MNGRPITVIVAAKDRPHFLAVTLAALHRLNGMANARLVIALDKGAPGVMREVIEVQANGLGFESITTLPSPDGLAGLSGNLLSAYAWAVGHARHRRELVALIEEDVLVGPDFLQWAAAVHEAEPDIFAAIASLNTNLPGVRRTTDNPGAYYLSNGDYRSIAPTFTVERLATAVIPHHVAAFHRNPAGYIAQHFPTAPWPARQWTQQAGLIRRIQETGEHGPIAWAGMPRAYHFGWMGSNRRGHLQLAPGSWWEQKAQVEAIAKDPELMATATANKGDSVPEDFEAAAAWHTVERIPIPYP